VVRTLASHAGNRGSTPRGTTKIKSMAYEYFLSHLQVCKLSLPTQLPTLRLKIRQQYPPQTGGKICLF